jgi:hypothetical protein
MGRERELKSWQVVYKTDGGSTKSTYVNAKDEAGARSAAVSKGCKNIQSVTRVGS